MRIIIIISLAICYNNIANGELDEWWKSASIYQISPISFKDSNNDGYGDLQGVISKLDFLVDTGIKVALLSPFFKTPLVDFGYDISNYEEIDSIFGTSADFVELFEKAKEKGIKLILDFVPNHTSDKHDWFIKSQNRERGFDNFYVWHDGIPTINSGRPLPPNNWQSEYGGSSWEWNEIREQYYYHKFAIEQPDLNLREYRVVEALDKVLHFWLEKGASGFRVDAVSQLFEDPSFSELPDVEKNLPQTYELIERWRKLLDYFTETNGGDNRVLMPQVWDSKIEDLMSYYQGEDGTPRAQLPFNFMLINELNENSNAAEWKTTIDKYLTALPDGAIPNWFLGSHDHSRVGSRMGIEKIEAVMTLLLTLPGVAFTYNGDEIGMVDHRELPWEDTLDPQACNRNENDFMDISRDPARTPYQWDNSVFAGFKSESGPQPWLPVHPNYEEINLELQQNIDKSHYKLYKQLIELRQNETFTSGNFHSKDLALNVLGYSRTLEDHTTYVVVINLGSTPETVNINNLDVSFEDESEVVIASSLSDYESGQFVSTTSFHLKQYDSVILKARSNASMTTLSLLAIAMMIVKLFL